MRLVTYQKKEAYDKLINEGVLKITEEERTKTLPYTMTGVANIKDAYQYIIDNMKDVEGYEEGIISPIWAWYRWEGEKTSPASNDEHYQGELRITIEVDKKRVLLSDFDKFAAIFNDSYLPKTKLHRKYYDKHYKKYTDEDIKKTWKYIFKTFHLFGGYSHFSFKNRSIQATLWKITKEDIVEVKYIEKSDEDVRN